MLRFYARAGLLASVATVTMVPVAARAADAAAASDDGSEIVVSGVMPATVASAATKSATPIAETPQSISVIDSSEIKKLGLQNLNEALRYVAGVTPETRGSSAEVYDQFKLRGFDAPVYLDGLKQFSSASGYASTQVDLARLDRIEVLKGPSGALYGQSGPGGIVDQESKLPIDSAFYGAVSGTYGNYDLYRVDADVGGRIGDGALWRLYGSVNGAHDQQTYGKRRRQTISGAVTVGAGSSTSFTVLTAYSHDPRNGDYGVFPAVGTFFANPAGRIPTSFYGGEPGDYFSREQFGLTYIFKHDFGSGWSFRSAGRYQYVKSDLGIVYTGGTPVDASDPAPTLYSRYSYATHEQLDDWTYDNQLKGSVDTGPLHHDLLLGVDRQVAHSAELYAFGGGTPIDVFDPVYGTMATPSDPYHVINYSGVGFTTPFFVETRERQQGIYVQDQISVGGLRLPLSARQDWARTESSGIAQKDKKFTYRVGALYKTSIGVAPYVSYSTSFEPQAGTVSTDGGKTFENASPTLGKQIEAGVKYQVPGTQILLTGAWFDIHQTNVLTAVPLANYSLQSGEVRSRGFEIEGSAPLPHGFNAKVAFSRQSVKTTKDANPANIGAGLLSVGRGGVTANLDWSPNNGPAEGLTVGGAVRHVDSVYAGVYTDGIAYRTPAVTLFDALLRYDLGKAMPRLEGVTLGVNATNLLDKKYFSSCMAPYSWCWYGDRRTVQGTIGFKW
ncbi:TonB-dependent siderophore receptor [Sphingomonas sp. CGMCC 1.13654]|uniref:TonB-dependent siderophore receptor n=1 Tax=Sphingomonas chungangi TaxID=2683589 RepID=A0A838L5N6_9SPHN|nr:TonB-dependent siderophore receptor [Sphingomonas chungangi]MBA2934671.1 TonB-dependent siderophore receptor [Sphingomonas chungangi]MVW57982.1 TonB-dependent siderophore receptor [Sphingomonas chungangi]